MSVTFAFEPSGAPKAPERLDDTPSLGEASRSCCDDSGRVNSTLPAVLPPTAPGVLSLKSETTVSAINAASEAAHDAQAYDNAVRVANTMTAQASPPTSTRSAHKPAVLSLSLHSQDIDPSLMEKQVASWANTSHSASNAEAPATDSSSVAAVPDQRGDVVSTRSPLSSQSQAKPTQQNKTPSKQSAATTPSVPMLHLPVKTCKDEVTPVKTLYTRLFHEAQQREQRQAQAQRKQRAAQKAEEKEKCTFHPRGVEAMEASSPPAKKARASAARQAPTPVHASNSSSSSPSTPQAMKLNQSATSAAEEETAACERLYRNADQAERRERRLQQLREAQEEEFRSICTFHPCVSPSAEGRQRSRSNSHRSVEAMAESHDDQKGGAAATAPRSRSGTSPRGQARSWEHFLADQEERQATHERRMEELKKRTEEQARAELYTGVPRSKASEHLKKYLEKKKGYKGPIEGWSERFDHYMKVKQAAEAASSTRPATTATRPVSDAKAPRHNGASAEHQDGSANTPSSTRSRSRNRSESNSAPRSTSVFHRLYHDSDEREAMRELIRLMREQHEQKEFFKPNNSEAPAHQQAGRASGSSPSPQRSQTTPNRADTAQETAAAVAVAAGGADPSDDAPASASHRHEDDGEGGNARSIFDALYAEKEKLQRRRELQHVQAQNKAEVYPFHPRLSTHSRELAKELARQKASGQHAETVRERRAREAADMQAHKAARQAQVQFRYDSFAHRQAERDCRRQKELLQVLLHERSEDVEACRFRPAISEVTEAIVEGNMNYTQVIDDPAVAHGLMTRRCSSSSASKSAARNASTRQARSAGSTLRAGAAPSAAEDGKATTSSHARHTALTPVQALAAGADDAADHSHDTKTETLFYDAYSVPVRSHSTASSSGSGDADQNGTAQQGKTHSRLPAEVKAPEGDESSTAQHVDQYDGLEVANVSTVHIAGAASSDYLRQLESELQDALKDWSQCI